MPGPKPLPEAQQRRRIIGARVTTAEKKIVKETARACGLTVNSLIYQLVMDKARQVGVFAGSRPVSGENVT